MDLTTLIPQFGGALWTVIFFVVALSVIIAVHEYGHFIVGKKTGIFPEVFSLGFGPVLWSRVDRDGTVWQLAAIPFGGYVKFRGDANASGGVDEDAIEGLDEAEMRSTMAGAPLWARAATVAAGPALEQLYLERVGAMAGGGLNPDQEIHDVSLLGMSARRTGDMVEIALEAAFA